MSNLMLHCGAERTEGRPAVYAVRTPPHTETWFPLPHQALIEQVESALTAANLKITAETHALSHEGNRYFGLLQVGSGQGSSADYSWVVGLRNSHDQTFPAGLVVGSRVFVCDNLSFTGEVRIGRKHTRWIERDLPQLTAMAISRLVERWNLMDQRIEAYRACDLTDAAANDLVIRALDHQVLAASAIPKVLQEWRTPRHPEFAPRTAWSLMNAFTEVAKGTSLWSLPKRTEALHGLLDGYTGVAASIVEQINQSRQLEAAEDAEAAETAGRYRGFQLAAL